MKILILCFLLFSSNGFAQYMSKLNILDCNKLGRISHSTLKLCQKVHADCMIIPQSVMKNCEINSDLDTQIDDLDNPKYSKNEIEVCTDQAACEILNVSKSCLDLEETVYMAQDYSEIYCSKPNGFNQMTVKIIREDAAKKSIWDAVQANKVSKRLARQVDEGMLKGLIVSLKAGTDLTPVQNRKLQILIIRKLNE